MLLITIITSPDWKSRVEYTYYNKRHYTYGYRLPRGRVQQWFAARLHKKCWDLKEDPLNYNLYLIGAR